MSRGGELPAPTERQIQRASLEMIRTCFPRVLYHHSAVTLLSGTPKQRGMQMGAMKGDGFKVGFPDIICLWPVRTGCLIEFKRPKGGVVSDKQDEMHKLLVEIGWPVRVCKSVDDAYAFLRESGAPWNGVPWNG
jgi:hypothetical protein